MIPPTPAKYTSESPAQFMTAVTPHNTNEIADYVPKGVWVGGAGNITGQLFGDTSDTAINGIPAGTFLPLSFRIIKATGTSATNIVAVW